MAKSIRSKVKRHFRTQKRKTVEATEHYQQAELEKAEAQNAIANAPKPPRPLTSGPQLAFDRPSGMDVDDTLPPIISSNPAKLLKKLKKRRLGTQHGVTKAKTKKSKPLAGANQFFKKKRKR